MKISITDSGSGITQDFAKAIGATVRGRFIDIPEDKGGGYLTGFSWGSDLRMLIRNYHLKEDVVIDRTNILAEDQDDVVFLLSGIFGMSVNSEKQLLPELAYVLICTHAVSSILAMPSNTLFGSVTIAVAREYLSQLFGKIDHPVVVGLLKPRGNFAFETSISPDMIRTGSEILHQSIPESIENHYYKLKCEELLCYVFAQLVQREAMPAASMHINDIKAVYVVKSSLQLHPNQPPDIAGLAREAGMSEPKLRKLFKQTFGKGIFEYYQFERMQEAAKLLTGKKLTVAEVGYELGFTNLSHFSRVFEGHFGIKPKKYSALQANQLVLS